MIKAVILDMNGVLLESQPLSDRMKQTYGISPEKFIPVLKEIMPQIRKPKAPSIYSLFEPHFKKWNLNLKEKELLQFWFSGEKLVIKLLDYVKNLKRKGLKILVLSNNFKERTTYYQKHFLEISPVVDKAYFSWKTGLIKPEPEAFRDILNENQLQPEECLYFDDSQTNVDSANFLGIHAFKYEGLQKMKKIVTNLMK